MRYLIMIAAMFFAMPAAAQQASMEAFAPGPVFKDFGAHAPIEGMTPIPADATFAHAFDVREMAKEGTRNRGFESAARFINMHAAAGVPQENIRVAVVVHGKAVHDLLTAAPLEAREMPVGGSSAMVRAMLDHGVRVIVCGQSATAYGVSLDNVLPGVEIALSAMTAHALLQQQGYTVNPF